MPSRRRAAAAAPSRDGQATQAMAIGSDGYRFSQLDGRVRHAGTCVLNESGTREIIDHQIDVISDQLGPVFCADETGFSKPSSRAYTIVCEALTLPPAEVLHVGDRPDLDREAPRAAGLRAVQIDRPLTQVRIAGAAHTDPGPSLAGPIVNDRDETGEQLAPPSRISSLRELSRFR